MVCGERWSASADIAARGELTPSTDPQLTVIVCLAPLSFCIEQAGRAMAIP